MKEFHDLAEQLLNHESGGSSCWGNLGYWQNAATYPEACTALADALGSALDLQSDTRLLDVGFGCGDQLLHWLQHYKLSDVYGLNLSRSQTELARQRLQQAGYEALSQRMRQGSVSELKTLRRGFGSVDAVLALDCAYHFPSRENFIKDAASVLTPAGKLGVTDIILARTDLTLREKLPLRLIAGLSHLPAVNLITEDQYQQQWMRAGFEIELFQDITTQVFTPFGDWLKNYKATLDETIKNGASWKKYDATARFLRWAQENEILRYVICTGKQD